MNAPAAVEAGAVDRAGRSWAAFRVRAGRLEPALLETGRRNPDEVEILSGLPTGDEAVLRPARESQPGLPVRSTSAPE